MGSGLSSFGAGAGHSALGFVGLGSLYDPEGKLSREVRDQQNELTQQYRDQQIRFEKATQEIEQDIIKLAVELSSQSVKYSSLAMQPMNAKIKMNTSLIMSNLTLIVTIVVFLLVRPNHVI